MRGPLLTLVRDIVIVLFCLFLAGIVIAASADHFPANSPQSSLVTTVATSLALIFGFAFIALLDVTDRWARLPRTALSIWILFLWAVFFFQLPIFVWFVLIVYFAILCMIGGGLSVLIRRKPKAPPAAPEHPPKHWP